MTIDWLGRLVELAATPRGDLMRRIALVALTSVLMMVIAGCGLVSSSGTFREAFLADGSTPPLEGTEIRVTSKNFSESVLLGKITATYLAAAGASVKDLTNAPGSMSSRQALLNGDADILWEYTGTAWQTYLGETETISDPNELWQRVRDADRANGGAEWLPPAAFNNTYAFAASAPTAERLNVTKMSDIAKLPVSERTFCINDEFLSRADGMIPMLEPTTSRWVRPTACRRTTSPPWTPVSCTPRRRAANRATSAWCTPRTAGSRTSISQCSRTTGSSSCRTAVAWS